MSNMWKMIQEKNEIAKHMQKKHKHVLVPSERYRDSKHLLLNAKVPKNVMAFSNRAQTCTPLNYLS